MYFILVYFILSKNIYFVWQRSKKATASLCADVARLGGHNEQLRIELHDKSKLVKELTAGREVHHFADMSDFALCEDVLQRPNSEIQVLISPGTSYTIT